ncbi:MAG: hypothetical protein NTY48_00745 [Candidatus Diapherotrites archaeon]|nr:hypothetical protein [Candidatus Diapherotrites archaeon]
MSNLFMPQQPITNIFLVMHPLHGIYRELHQCADKKEFIHKANPLIKNELHNLGLFLQKAKAAPNSILLFVPSNEHHKEGDLQIDKDVARFLKRAKNELGSKRVLELKPEFGFRGFTPWPANKGAEAVQKAFENANNLLASVRFSNNVHIEATGSYIHYCINIGIKRISSILQQRSIATTSTIDKSAKLLQRDQRILLEALTFKFPKLRSNWKKRAGKLRTKDFDSQPTLGEFNRWRRETFGKVQHPPKRRP